MQNRLKSKVVWGAVLAQVVAILIALGVIDTGLGETFNTVIAGILQILVAFGVLNNPTDAAKF